ncbi:hypothetical protein CHARACLAT_001466, partial [Characodon lateralis]|nr:hypothetical protein [Characodon lateralis]
PLWPGCSPPSGPAPSLDRPSEGSLKDITGWPAVEAGTPGELLLPPPPFVLGGLCSVLEAGRTFSTLPLLWSEPSDALGFNANLQQLHATIVAYRSARKRKRPKETGAEQNQPSPEPSAQTLTPDGDDPTRDEGNQNSSKQVEPSEARRPAAQTKQPAPITTCPVERPTSKPKKKKVGLFK